MNNLVNSANHWLSVINYTDWQKLKKLNVGKY